MDPYMQFHPNKVLENILTFEMSLKRILSPSPVTE